MTLMSALKVNGNASARTIPLQPEESGVHPKDGGSTVKSQAVGGFHPPLSTFQLLLDDRKVGMIHCVCGHIC
jgi:hypothetical protein